MTERETEHNTGRKREIERGKRERDNMVVKERRVGGESDIS